MAVRDESFETTRIQSQHPVARTSLLLAVTITRLRQELLVSIHCNVRGTVAYLQSALTANCFQ